MTLVIAALTNQFAVLASDRRIQWSRVNGDSREIYMEEDSDTKSSIVDRRFVMGFAGLGRIFQPGQTIEQTKGRRLEGWLLDVLKDVPSDSYFDVIAEEFGPLCEGVGYERPHEFVAVGFEGEEAAPCMVTVGNSQRFPHTFVAESHYLGNEPYIVRCTGESVTDEIRERLEEGVRHVNKWDPAQPWSLHRRMVRTIREVSATSAGRVGETVTVTSLPRVAVPVEVGMNVFVSTPDREAFRTMEISQTYRVDGSTEMNPPARISEGVLFGGAVVRFGDGGTESHGPPEGLFE